MERGGGIWKIKIFKIDEMIPDGKRGGGGGRIWKIKVFKIDGMIPDGKKGGGDGKLRSSR